MAFTAGEIVYRITGDNSGFKKAAKDTEKQAKGLGKQFASISKLVKGALATAAVVGIKNVTKELINAAAVAEETRNKFNVTFKGIGDEATLQAKQIAAAYGLSQQKSEEFLASTGDLLTGFNFSKEAALDFSTSLTKLAVDLGSFQNISTERAQSALQKAILGEAESAKSLGIVIRQNTKEFRDNLKTLQETKGLTEQQARAQLIYAQILDQSKNAIGDFARSQQSYTNQTKILKANIEDLSSSVGRRLLPGFTNAVSSVNKLFDSTGDLTSKTSSLVAISNEYSSVLKKLRSDTLKLDTIERALLQVRKDQLELKLREKVQEVSRSYNEQSAATENATKKSEKLANKLLKQRQVAESLAKQIEELKKQNENGTGSAEKYSNALERQKITQEILEQVSKDYRQSLIDEKKEQVKLNQGLDAINKLRETLTDTEFEALGLSEELINVADRRAKQIEIEAAAAKQAKKDKENLNGTVEEENALTEKQLTLKQKYEKASEIIQRKEKALGDRYDENTEKLGLVNDTIDEYLDQGDPTNTPFYRGLIKTRNELEKIAGKKNKGLGRIAELLEQQTPVARRAVKNYNAIVNEIGKIEGGYDTADESVKKFINRLTGSGGSLFQRFKDGEITLSELSETLSFSIKKTADFSGNAEEAGKKIESYFKKFFLLVKRTKKQKGITEFIREDLAFFDERAKVFGDSSETIKNKIELLSSNIENQLYKGKKSDSSVVEILRKQLAELEKQLEKQLRVEQIDALFKKLNAPSKNTFIQELQGEIKRLKNELELLNNEGLDPLAGAEVKDKIKEINTELNKYIQLLKQAQLTSLAEGLKLGGESLDFLSTSVTAYTNLRLQGIDAELQAELEKNNLIEESTSARLQRELDETRSTLSAKQIAEKQDAIDRAKLEEKYAKKRADAEYKGALAAWVLNIASTTAKGAEAVVSAYTGPPITWPVTVPAAIIAGATSLAGVIGAKPQKPAGLASGGIVNPNNGGTNVLVAENNNPELMFNNGESGRPFVESFTKALSKEMAEQGTTVNIYQDGILTTSNFYKKTKNGEINVHSRAIK